MPGYIDFLAGFEAGGGTIHSVVSRRPDILPRRLATRLSLSQLGLNEYFTLPNNVKLTGDEQDKADLVLMKAPFRPIGMIDDYPNKIGACLLSGLQDSTTGTIVTLGAVAGEHQSERIEELLDSADDLGAGINRIDGDHWSIGIKTSSLSLRALGEYSRMEGVDFYHNTLDVFNYFHGEY